MQINILGYGLMAKQIGALFYISGYTVNIWHYREIMEKDFFRQVKILNKSFPDATEGEVKFHNNIEELPDVFTIESVVENLDIKKDIYSKFINFKSPYASNTSSYSPLEIGEKVNGIHFFNPINLKLLEAFYVDASNEAAINGIIEPIVALDISIIKCDHNRGYIGNYILFHEISSCLKLIEKYNYSVESIEDVSSKLYGKRSIFRIIDIIGIDTVYAILKNLKEVDDTIYLPYSLLTAIERNILGKKNKTSIKEVVGG